MTDQSLRIGSKLKGVREYTITEQLHHGGFGITYKATAQIMVGNIPQVGTFTIKEFFIGKICSRCENGCITVAAENKEMFRQAKQDFMDEANILHSLKHKNIVPVNEVFEQNDTIYYVMSYLGSISLYNYVAEHGGRLSEATARNVIEQLSSAVAYLHNRNILHLDIKPDNVMMISDGNDTVPVLIDFGQAMYFVGDKPKRNKGVGGYSMGYSPIELKQGVTTFIPEADIYSLSATLMYMLTGTDPCDASEQSIHKIYKALPENISQNTTDAIVCGMRKDNNVSIKDISAFQTVLQLGESEAMTSTGGTAENGHRITDPLNIKHPSQDSYMKKISIAVACLAVAGIGVWLGKGVFTATEDSGMSTVKADSDSIQKDTMKFTATAAPVKESKDQTSEKHSASNDIKEEKESPSSAPPRKEEPVRKHDSLPTSGTVDLGYATWTGGLLNGKPHGSGVMRFRSSHSVSGCTTTPHAGDYIEGYCENGVLQHGNLYQNGVKVENFVR